MNSSSCSNKPQACQLHYADYELHQTIWLAVSCHLGAFLELNKGCADPVKWSFRSWFNLNQHLFSKKRPVGHKDYGIPWMISESGDQQQKNEVLDKLIEPTSNQINGVLLQRQDASSSSLIWQDSPSVLVWPGVLLPVRINTDGSRVIFCKHFSSKNKAFGDRKVGFNQTEIGFNWRHFKISMQSIY